MGDGSEHKVTPNPGQGSCLLCGTTETPTREHIIPQALWKRFGVDPNRPDLADFWTTLCEPHNQATSALHARPEMLQLIERGEPVTAKSLSDLADWAIWVTLLLGLERGSGVLGPDRSRQRLLERFDAKSVGTPRGVRVYAARISKLVDPVDPPITSHLLALHGDARIALDNRSRPAGLSVQTGPVAASESIAVGAMALLVVGRTYESGPDHNNRLDQAVASVGLSRIHPLSKGDVPPLIAVPVSMSDVSRLFTVMPFDVDWSLTPEAIRSMSQFDGTSG